MTDSFEKYDLPVPRYTSYPTVPYWSGALPTDVWLENVRRVLAEPATAWSLYIHVPFCESQCTFCGCNNIISRSHDRESPYVEHVLKEWALYRAAAPQLIGRTLRHVHVGGGSPTYLTPENFRRLLTPILQVVQKDQREFEGAIEVDPRTTSLEKLTTYRALGFNRVSIGIQDFEPEVQRLVNRMQPYEMTADINRLARELGFTGVNFDLIYGLPKQSAESFRRTAEQTVAMRPDRIALYSFALVPWIKRQHRIFKDEDLPRKAVKWELYRIARSIFLSAGYVEVGMDHFALPTDSLAEALRQGRLHRNFMGYTNQRTDLVLGLGMSSISETPWSFHQNEKDLIKYSVEIDAGKIPTLRGHMLTEDDRHRREQILKLMTTFRVSFVSPEEAAAAREFLTEMIQDGFVGMNEQEMWLTATGRPFLRIACLFFDQRLRDKQPEGRLFSQAV
ncbi:MAG: oxygen-independent coproporphyrinogen III oxidase [Verrucomicrobia bacterium]|nr:MAG: oxygen-independent coproporphyrinogen III oxidase [Verrucomicrobiota bacterium]